MAPVLAMYVCMCVLQVMRCTETAQQLPLLHRTIGTCAAHCVVNRSPPLVQWGRGSTRDVTSSAITIAIHRRSPMSQLDIENLPRLVPPHTFVCDSGCVPNRKRTCLMSSRTVFLSSWICGGAPVLSVNCQYIHVCTLVAC